VQHMHTQVRVQVVGDVLLWYGAAQQPGAELHDRCRCCDVSASRYLVRYFLSP
jgi:hypothetical protein